RGAGPLADALDRAIQERRVAAAVAAPPPAPRQLRVDEERVDRLFALAGELVVAKNTLGWLAGSASGLAGSAGDDRRRLQELHASFDRLTRDLHDAVVRIRMVPVGQVFERFPRLVRDLSARLGKPVDLTIEGETTSADKTVVESLHEPLLHLVRNSLDHGIETPDERRLRGKRDVATVSLRARHANDRVVVEVQDDGRGIDLAAVGRKAMEAGVIDAERLATLDEAATAALIFAPGLSTAAETSDLSGRGIGMYAVRMAIERIGGTIGIETSAGRGTTTRLELPLTLALLRIVIVHTGGRAFGVPLDGVAETIRLPRERVRRVRGQAAFTWRDRVVPLNPLARLLGLDEPVISDGDGMVLIAKVGGAFHGVAIDGISDRLEVALRPMDGLLADIPAYLGTTLRGDGQVLLILNLKEILS
ncbi:hypothetical protein N825_12755, partial [Skermanella stibiiresistens SB22]